MFIFFFKQKTAYEMRISDWSSDVCSSDLAEEQGDPRMELVRRLQEYERFKTAGETIEKLPRIGRDLYLAQARPEVIPSTAQLPMPRLSELVLAFRDIMERVSLYKHHEISREPLSVRERMTHILSRIQRGPAALSELVDPEEGRLGEATGRAH